MCVPCTAQRSQVPAAARRRSHQRVRRSARDATHLHPLVSYTQAAPAGRVCAHRRRQVFAWGFNGHFELGLGEGTHRNSPQLVRALESRNVTTLAAGGYHAMAVTGSGALLTWGASLTVIRFRAGALGPLGLLWRLLRIRCWLGIRRRH
jgi:alpha-tubulin suppressor-like RCC1 family protein